MSLMLRIASMVLLLPWIVPAISAYSQSSLGQGPRFFFSVSESAPPTRVDARTLPTLATRLSVHFQGETRARALEIVSEQTGLRFIYSADLVRTDGRVTLEARDIALAAVLTEILMDVDADVVFAAGGQVALVSRARAPQGEITGRVVDAVTRQSIPNAIVAIVPDGISTLTGQGGDFRLRPVPPGVVSIRVTAFGYTSLIQTDVVVGTGRPATILAALTPSPVALTGITLGPRYFAQPRETPTSTQRLNPEEVRRTPGAQEDVVRAVSVLPGVVPTAIHDNRLLVRGGAPFENLFIVDGLEVPNINHYAVQGQSSGQVSLVNLAFLRDAEFSAGGFGASQGDRIGSVTTLTLREGSRDRHGGEANLAATGFGMIAEGPVGSGSYLAGVRRSYFDLILKLAGESWAASYWDANVKVVQRLSDRDMLSWTFIGATDRFDFIIETDDDLFDAAMMAVNMDQYFTGLTWSRSGERSVLDVTAGRIHYAYDTFQNDTLGIPIFTNRSTETENSLRIAYARAISGGSTFRTGMVAKYDGNLAYDIRLPGELRPDLEGAPRRLDVDTAFTAFRAGAYSEATVQWTPRFSTTLGGRLDYYRHLGDAVRFAPRLAASLDLTHATSLNLSGGRYWQMPSFIWLMGDPSNLENLRPLWVDQGVVGLQALPREDLKVQVEAYYKRYASYPTREWRPQAVLTPGIEHVPADIPFGLEPLTSRGTGYAYGAEFFLQKRPGTAPVYGLASLSLNRTRFTALDGVERVGAFEAPIVFSLAGGWRRGTSWELGGRFRIGSGLPRTPYIEDGPQEGRLDFDRYNQGGRMPTFHALDLRADRRWGFNSFQLTAYLEIQDVYNRDNPIVYVWDERLRAPRYEHAVGLLPSIGINVVF